MVKLNLISIGANISYQLISRFITAVASFFVARLIITTQPNLWGEYQTLITYVTVFWLLTDFGLNAVAVKQMSQVKSDISTVFGSLLTLRTVLGILLMLFSLLILLFLPYSFELKLAISIGLITLITQGIRGATHGLFQSKLSYQYLFFSELVGTVFFVFSLWWLLRFDPPITTISIVFVIAQAIMMITSVFFARRISPIRLTMDFSILKPMIIATVPLGISLLFNLGNFKLDVLLLSIMKDTDSVGIYNAGYKFFEFALIIPTFFMNSMYPVLLSTFSVSRTQFFSQLKLSFIILLVISIVGAIIGFATSPLLISLLGGSNAYLLHDSVTVLRILILTIPLFYVSSFLMWGIVILGSQRFLVPVYMSAFAINFLLNIIFIPTHGYFASAVSTGISEMVVVIVLAIKIYSLYKKGALRGE